MARARFRFIVPRLPAAGARLALPEGEAVHARARRLAVGDPVLLFDGSGAEAEAEIVSVGREETFVTITAVRAASVSGPSVWLGVSAVRPERVSWLAEKSGELAVDTLSLVRSERTQAFRAAPNALSRLERLVREAAKQSGSLRWPTCEGPVDFASALATAPGEIRLFVDFTGEPIPASLSAGSVAVLVGPEGGWTDSERAEAASAGWRVVALPAGTLRSETAAVAAVVLVRAALARAAGDAPGAC